MAGWDGMTMPGFDDQTPQLGELFRTMTDFRLEVRSLFADMVRKEVYVAEMSALKGRVEALEGEKRSTRAWAYSSTAGAGIAILMWLIQSVGSR
jgi:hypothetical protein